ncbi:MAG: right-handed parallel beta-helix repeat-containing protein [Nitrospinae bacterium]|nr:right-handed parallel beta-helix repeat-containing protein [Nitrospinota bacterium]
MKLKLAGLFAVVALIFSTGASNAATISVAANAPDALNGADASCALREAIQNMNDGATTYADCANTGAAYGTSDTINLPAGTYTNAIAGVGEDANATGDMDIIANVTITGAGAGSSIIDGGAIDRVIHIGAGRIVSFSGVTIRNGSIADHGGGIANAGTLTITNSTISGNTVTGLLIGGGGLYSTGGVLNITNSTISGNNSDFVNGYSAAIYINVSAATITNSTISGNTGSVGGIFVLGGSALTMTGSTFSGNSGNAYIFVGSTATITNSTFANNTIAGAMNGVITSTGNITIKNSTFSGSSPYGLSTGGGATITVSNSIVSGSATSDCKAGSNITSSGHNLDSDNTCNLIAAGDIPNSALANLGALASNGGSTQTMALLTGSAAINAGDCSAGAVTTDQRGTARPQGPACDIGAYEFDYYTLSTTVTGTGTVTSDTAGTNCPGTCAESLAPGTSVTLTAAAGAGYTFTGWSGACAGSAATCNLTMNTAKSVTATFAAIYTLTTSVTGNGTVTSNTAGTNCPGTCAESLASGTAVILTATPSAGYMLSAWGGSCAGSAATCNVTVNADTSVTATFVVIPPGVVPGCTDPLATNYNPSATLDDGTCAYTLSTTVTGNGTVTSNTAGTNCPGTCAENITDGTAVILTATPSAGYSLSSWGGACSGTAATCNITVTAATNVTATFAIRPPGVVHGCADYHATNHNPRATVDDGSCVYPDPDFGDNLASPLEFGTGEVNSLVQKTVTLKNTGPISTYVYGLDISGTPFSIVSDSCSGNIIWNTNTCDIVILFNSSSAGSFTGYLNVWTNSERYKPLHVSLTAKATASIVSPATLISPADGVTLAGTQVTFEWTAGSDATGAIVTDNVHVCEQSDFKGCETPALTSRSGAVPAGIIILLGFAAPFGLRNRRIRSALLTLVFIAAGGATLWACGGGSSSSGQPGKSLTLKADTKYYCKVVTASVNGTKESEVRSFTTGK